MSKKAYIALGSNIGEPALNIADAVAALGLVPGVRVTGVSKNYITKPWGYVDQPDFTNACCEVECDLSPEALLGVCLGIEAGMGRIRNIKNGPRIIDLDLIVYEDERRDTAELKLPHPGMLERDFVLMPLLDISENGKILDVDVADALNKLHVDNN